ncbi:MAG: T9SS type A sorting domain-containing protein [Bacteroidetes bacterium]|nr:MAG: T9SS type A sorting domain-containing protein [Bacteroidota bacterium]
MRFSQLFIFFILLAQHVSAQSWTSMGDSLDGAVSRFYYDTLEGRLIAIGAFEHIGAMEVDGVAAWDGVDWHPLATGINTGFNPVYAICRFQGEIYSEGLLGTSNIGNESVLKLNNGEWESVGIVHGGVRRLRETDDRMYAVGDFDSIGSVVAHSVAAWDGFIWQAIGNDLNTVSLFPIAVNDIAEYHGELYVIGKFDDGEGLANIAKLVDDTWQPVGGGIRTWNGFGTDLLVYKDMLYVAGFFQQEEGNVASNIMAWDGENWFSPQGGVTFPFGEGGFIRSMTTDGDYIYVAGVFDTAGGLPISEIARWDGQNWCGFDVWTNNGVRTLVNYQNNLVMAGSFYWVNSEPIPNIAKADYYVDECGDVGIDPITVSEQSLIYPNPTATTFTITWPQRASGTPHLSMYDAQGRQVNPQTSLSAKGQLEVNMRGLAPGIYFGRLQVGNDLMGFKVVRE